jgi:DNA-binding response OmpR family regulator
MEDGVDPAQIAVFWLGPATAERDVLDVWSGERGIRLIRNSFDEPLDLGWLETAAFVVLDALEDPALAIAECARLRAAQPTLPIVLLGNDRLSLERAALRAGSTVFLERPLPPARLQSYGHHFVVSRSVSGVHGIAPKVGVDHDVVLDRSGRRLFIEGEERPLTRDSFNLLSYFIENPGRAIAPDELVLRGVLSASQARRYRATICALRNQLGSAAHRIQLVRGYGYRFDPPQGGVASSELTASPPSRQPTPPARGLRRTSSL